MSEETQPQKSIDDVIADLLGFGIEECEEALTVTVGKRTVKLRISNLPTDEEIIALARSEGFKGQQWINKIKAETFARSITWIDGLAVKDYPYVKDPKTGEVVQIQNVLVDLVMGWGTVVTGVLWKILMVHTQRLEDKLIESFPDSAIFTDVEKRFLDRAMEELEAMGSEVLQDAVDKITEEPE